MAMPDVAFSVVRFGNYTVHRTQWTLSAFFATATLLVYWSDWHYGENTADTL